MKRMPKPRPLSPQAAVDATRRMVDRLVAEGHSPKPAAPKGAPKPTGGAR